MPVYLTTTALPEILDHKHKWNIPTESRKDSFNRIPVTQLNRLLLLMALNKWVHYL